MMQAAEQVVGNGAVERRMSSDHIKVNPHRNSILGQSCRSLELNKKVMSKVPSKLHRVLLN